MFTSDFSLAIVTKKSLTPIGSLTPVSSPFSCLLISFTFCQFVHPSQYSQKKIRFLPPTWNLFHNLLAILFNSVEMKQSRNIKKSSWFLKLFPFFPISPLAFNGTGGLLLSKYGFLRQTTTKNQILIVRRFASAIKRASAEKNIAQRWCNASENNAIFRSICVWMFTSIAENERSGDVCYQAFRKRSEKTKLIKKCSAIKSCFDDNWDFLAFHDYW